MQQLLGWYGIALVPAEPAADLDRGASRPPSRLGWPVALKVAGAVRLHLADPAAVAEAWHSLGGWRGAGAADGAARHGHRAAGARRSVLRRADVLRGGRIGHRPAAGPGLRGGAADRVDGAELISGPKAFPLLTGYGGAEPADLPALVELALRLSRLADELPEVVDCALDPVVAAPSGAWVLTPHPDRPADRTGRSPRPAVARAVVRRRLPFPPRWVRICAAQRRLSR